MLATHSEAVQEFALNIGQDNIEQCWLLTSYDTWVRNPFYNGPIQPHPESYDYEDED